MKRIYHPLFLIGMVIILATLACTPPIASNPTQELPPPTATSSLPEATATKTSPTPEAADTESPPVVNTNECTVLQDLNLRTGPGLAYHTPIGVIPGNTVVEPVSYYPEGVPGGTWVLIEESDDHPIGWIAAGNSFITCTFDLNTLPTVQVDAPPPPLPPRSARSSQPEGGCGPEEDYQCDVIITDESFIQFKIFQNKKELTENDNIEQVSFSVRRGGKDDNGKEVYSKIENNSAYCIFGGNQPCGPWEIQNNTYFWPGGPALEPGKYFIEIFATVNENGDKFNVRWAAEFDVTLP